MTNARLVKTIPQKRLRLISGDASKPPAIGDLGETDQRFSGFWGPMVLVYFTSADGKTEWEAEAYESEIEPLEDTIQQMAVPELIELWKKIKADLRRARDTLPLEADQNLPLSEYQQSLEYNELELACAMLETYAKDHPVSRDFWLTLRDASIKMHLHVRAARYARRAAGE